MDGKCNIDNNCYFINFPRICLLVHKEILIYGKQREEKKTTRKKKKNDTRKKISFFLTSFCTFIIKQITALAL
jgi:hypothetical protein